MTNQFNVNEVKSNGVGGQGYQAVLVHKDAIVEICKEVRDLLGLDKIFELITKDDTNDYYRGHRFEEVDNNAHRLISALARHCSTYLNDDTLIEMHIPAVLKTLTTEDKVTLVVDACRDCAGADHWYAFEKDWG
jgi:hypothetical protein